VCGGSIPVFGGVQLDMTAFAGIRSIDKESGIADVGAGTFGDVLEDVLRDDHGLTMGHWPQSIALSTVGGWLACRSAGQLSNKYGKIEDMVVSLDVVLADGTAITTAAAPRAAVGPDLNQVFVGSEGTLGVITGARVRVHPLPTAHERAAFTFTSFAAGLEACRLTSRAGIAPAVMRLYDATEAQRNFAVDSALVIAFDEGSPRSAAAVLADASDACLAAGGVARDDADALVGRWLDHRNNVSQLQTLVQRDVVVDTIEISGPWSRLPDIYTHATAALRAIDGTVAASAHQSHAYPDGACLYFTFAAILPLDGLSREEVRERKTSYYRAAWDAVTAVVLANGGALSHHHGVGLNRSRFVPDALGASFGVFTAIKNALDPRGILNPGKLGLAHPFGATQWDPTGPTSAGAP
jgi:alkyldihydroxyacetonephosphate synthase